MESADNRSMSKPNITTDGMSLARLLEYHKFCCEQSLDYSEGTTPKGRRAWRRERNRVEAEIQNRQNSETAS